MSRLRGKVVIAQGGGPTAVINQSLVGAVLESRKFSEITRVWGAVHGVRGIINETFIDLSEATTHNLELVAGTPSSALGSTRDKPDAEYCHRIFNVFKKHDVRYFFYIGGNDSSDTVRIVNEQADQEGYELRAIHIPKTVDNDLPINDHCPGYPSAARFVACAISGVNADNNALPGVYIAVIMGRHAGWLTAAAALARKHDDDGPHLIYVPERPFSIDRYLSDIDRMYKQHGRCIVALSEGVWATRNEQGKEVPLAVDLMAKRGASRSLTRTATFSYRAGRWLTSWRILCRRGWASNGCARIPSAICNARFPGWYPMWMPAKRAKSARRRRIMPAGTMLMVQWSSSALVTMR
jgi:6-phosphofructokinase